MSKLRAGATAFNFNPSAPAFAPASAAPKTGVIAPPADSKPAENKTVETVIPPGGFARRERNQNVSVAPANSLPQKTPFVIGSSTPAPQGGFVIGSSTPVPQGGFVIGSSTPAPQGGFVIGSSTPAPQGGVVTGSSAPVTNPTPQPAVISASPAPSISPSVMTLPPEPAVFKEPETSTELAKDTAPAPSSETWDEGNEGDGDEGKEGDNEDDEEIDLAELEANPELREEYEAVKRERKEREDKKIAAAFRRAEKMEAAKAEKDSKTRIVDPREHLNIVFIGHVDAGKSTISGQIMLATGQVDDRTIARYKQEAEEKGRDSWYLAYILDSNDEEKAKGKTVEVGRAHFVTPTKRYTLLDAPGHKNYVPNMIGGAQQADVGVLVISARKSEFEAGFERGGQTREHAMLAKTLGMKRLIVLVNKMDEKTVEWRQERFDEIEGKLGPFLKKCGFNLKTEVFWVPCAGYSGQNIKDRYAGCSWYSGPSFLELLDQLPSVPRVKDGPVRLPVITRFKDMGFLFILGKLESGTLRNGDDIILMPKRLKGCVKGLLVDEEEVDVAEAGENVLIKVTGFDEPDVSDGMVICDFARPAQRTIMFDAQIQVMDLLPHRPIITGAYQAVLHVHSLTIECEITKLLEEHVPVKEKKEDKEGKKKKEKKTGKEAAPADDKGDKKKTAKKKEKASEKEEAIPTFTKVLNPPMIRTGSIAHVRIKTRSLMTLETFDDQPALGRFTLRDQGTTIAIGKVLKLAIAKSEAGKKSEA